MALIDLLRGEVESVGGFVIVAALTGLPFGFFMAVGLGAIHRRAGGGTSFGTHAQTAVELPVATDEAVRATVAAARTTPKATEPHVDEAIGTVRFRIGWSWKSWGERLAVRIEGDGAASKASIDSRSRFRATLVDYGKNQANVDMIASRLVEAVPGAVVSPPRGAPPPSRRPPRASRSAPPP